MAEIFFYNTPTVSKKAVSLTPAAVAFTPAAPRSAKSARSSVLPEWSLTILEESFSLYPYPDIYRREVLAEKCRVSVQKVSAWFRNKRNKGRVSQVAQPSTATIRRKGRWIERVPQLAPSVVSPCPGRSSKPEQFASKPISSVLPMPRSASKPRPQRPLTAHGTPASVHPITQSTGQRTSHPTHRRQSRLVSSHGATPPVQPLERQRQPAQPPQTVTLPVISPIEYDASLYPVDLSFHDQILDLSFSSVLPAPATEQTSCSVHTTSPRPRTQDVGCQTSPLPNDAASRVSPLKERSPNTSDQSDQVSPTPPPIFRPWVSPPSKSQPQRTPAKSRPSMTLNDLRPLPMTYPQSVWLYGCISDYERKNLPAVFTQNPFSQYMVDALQQWPGLSPLAAHNDQSSLDTISPSLRGANYFVFPPSPILPQSSVTAAPVSPLLNVWS